MAGAGKTDALKAVLERGDKSMPAAKLLVRFYFVTNFMHGDLVVLTFRLLSRASPAVSYRPFAHARSRLRFPHTRQARIALNAVLQMLSLFHRCHRSTRSLPAGCVGGGVAARRGRCEAPHATASVRGAVIRSE